MAQQGYYQNQQQQPYGYEGQQQGYPQGPPQAYGGYGQQQQAYPQPGMGGMQQAQYPQYQAPPQESQQNFAAKPEYAQEAFTPSKPKWNDVIFAILFYAQFFAFIALSVICLRTVTNAGGNLTGNSSNGLTLNLNSAYLLALIAALGLVFAIIALFLTRTFTRAILEIALLFSVVSTVGYAIYLWITKFWSGAIIFTILGVLAILAYFPMRKRIPFSRLILLFVFKIAGVHKSVYGIALATTLLQAVYSIWWGFTLVGIYQKYSPGSASGCETSGGNCGSGSLIGACVFACLSFYWTTQVISNVSLVTVSGVFGSYYFSATAEKTKHAARSSFRRAMTYSFGSIALGSLIVALLDLIRAAISVVQQQQADSGDMIGACLACFAQCIVGCIRGLVAYFNRYAYIEIALFGKKYVAAAKDAWNLLKKRGIDALINDCLVNNIWTLLSLTSGALGAIFSYVYLNVVRPAYIENNTSLRAVMILYSFGICFQITHSLGYVALSSGVSTIFVALAEAPGALAQKDPELFGYIQSTYPQVVTSV